MSNDSRLAAILAEHQEEQRRKERGLLADSYNFACGRDPFPTLNVGLPGGKEPRIGTERTRRNEVSDPVNKGIDATLNERGSRYGLFTGHAAITQGLKSVMKATPKWAALQPDQKEALEMVQHKIGRILNGDPDYHDSWHDIVGYAKLVADRLEGVQR